MPDQKPTVGRIVHYFDSAIGGVEPLAALVVFIDVDGLPNLHVYNPHSAGTYLVRSVKEGSGEHGTWMWPPRA